MDNAMCFKSEEFTEFCKSYGINISYASPYHPQGNGQAESNNKNIMKIIKRTLGKTKRAWDSKLKMALWADMIIVNKTIGTYPFELVYGCKKRMPINNLLPVCKFIHENNPKMLDLLEERMETLAELDESSEDAHRKKLKLQKKGKYLFDKKASERKFKINDLVLLWNAKAQDKGKHGKIEALWLGPFVVA
ncbi:uncharacterized protein LOC131857458 [Cryptomeria japonica]|uniref:uncharacterized protein LOC131857458 n=1 Tax=Cryptomeria japonica TaxID=3369 RepID=UPI0027DAAB48|nr:uncharacterized protein LOC131857458 [Cryptomeria japonica]